MPLALELAASRLRVMGVDEVSAAVSARLAVLRGGPDRPERQQAVSALISDSWEGLTATGRRVLTALGLFRVGATAGMLADAAGVDIVVCLDLLDDLVGRGLVRTLPRDGSAPRFAVLELVRRFALDSADPEVLRSLRRAHARTTADLATRGGSRVLPDLRDDVSAAVSAVRGSEPDDHDDTGFRLELARLALAFGWWDDVVSLLDRCADHADARNPLGVALLRRGREGDVDRGRALLQDAARDGDADAASALGGSVKADDPGRAHDWYLEALRLDPGDPYALGNVIEHEIVTDGAGALARRHDALVTARDRRRGEAEAGVDLPWSAYDLAKLRLWLGEDDAGLHALLDAVSSTTHARQVETTLASFELVGHRLGTSAWALAVDVLRLARLLHAAPRAVRADTGLTEPVLVIAGASATDAHHDVMAWSDVLGSACEGLGGSVVSGGTASGVSALAPLVAGAAGARSLGYLPELLPRGVGTADGYDELRRTDGAAFSLREPLTFWTDVLSAGVRPQDVHVLGLGGGSLTALELHLATAVGAAVAVADLGGRQVADRSLWHRPPRTVVREASVVRRWIRS